jgi:hypothetical protein
VGALAAVEVITIRRRITAPTINNLFLEPKSIMECFLRTRELFCVLFCAVLRCCTKDTGNRQFLILPVNAAVLAYLNIIL